MSKSKKFSPAETKVRKIVGSLFAWAEGSQMPGIAGGITADQRIDRMNQATKEILDMLNEAEELGWKRCENRVLAQITDLGGSDGRNR